MITGKENIENWFDMVASNGAIHWKICNEKNPNKILLSAGAEVSEEGSSPADRAGSSITTEYSRRTLIQSLSLLAPGKYLIIAKKFHGQGKGQYETIFQLTNQDLETYMPHRMHGLPDEDDDTSVGSPIIEKRIEEALEKYKLEQSVEQLTAQVNELSGHSKVTVAEQRMDKFLDALTPHIGTLLQAFIPGMQQNVAVTGTDIPTAADPAENQQERFNKACQTLGAATPDFIGTMEKLAALAEKDPEQYKLALTMLG